MQKVLTAALLLSLAAIISFNGCNDNDVTPNGGQNLQVVTSYSVTGTCVNSFITNIYGNDYAFLSLGTSGMLALNVNNPGSPSNAGTYAANGYTEEVYSAVIDSVPYAFIAAGGGGLVVLNIFNIGSPVVDTVMALTGDYLNSVYVDTVSKKLYTGGGYAKMYVMNLSALPVVTSIATYQSYKNINEIQVQNNVAYIAEDSALDVVNVSVPANPVRYSLGTSDDYAYDVRVSGSYAYISNNGNGVLVLNVSNPTNPQQISFLNTTDIALASTVSSNNIAYVAEDAAGVEAFDISNPSAPNYLASYVTNSYSEHVFYYKGYVFVSDYTRYVVLRGISTY